MKARGTLLGLLGIGLVAVAAVGVYGVFVKSFLQIRHLQIDGRVEVAAVREVREAVRAVMDGNLVTVDIGSVRQSVETIDWVKAARVTRQWPDSLHIQIDRHDPVAIWEDGRLVSTDGIVFASTDETIETLARLPLFSGDPTYIKQAVEFLPRLQKAAGQASASVKALHVSYRGSWSVRMENEAAVTIDVELGRNQSGQDVAWRFDRLTRYFNELSENLEGYPTAVDARYHDAFAVKLPDDQSGQAWREARLAPKS